MEYSVPFVSPVIVIGLAEHGIDVSPLAMAGDMFTV